MFPAAGVPVYTHYDLARLEGETSNQIFETLADWNHQLELSSTSYQDLEP